MEENGMAECGSAGCRDRLSIPRRSKCSIPEQGIYFLFNCEDKKLTSTLQGDFLDLYNEDVVEVFLWPDESFPVYFEYEVSPLNYELPIIIPNYKGTFYGWKPWHYEGERMTQHATSATGGQKVSGGSCFRMDCRIFYSITNCWFR